MAISANEGGVFRISISLADTQSVVKWFNTLLSEISLTFLLHQSTWSSWVYCLFCCWLFRWLPLLLPRISAWSWSAKHGKQKEIKLKSLRRNSTAAAWHQRIHWSRNVPVNLWVGFSKQTFSPEMKMQHYLYHSFPKIITSNTELIRIKPQTSHWRIFLSKIQWYNAIFLHNEYLARYQIKEVWKRTYICQFKI